MTSFAFSLPGSKFLVGDFNGDGFQDLAVLGTDRSITLSLSSRDGTSRQAPTFFGAPEADALILTGIFY
ncbi:MAG: FG-GAP repeat protein [Bryobacteraceae bacterium]